MVTSTDRSRHNRAAREPTDLAHVLVEGTGLVGTSTGLALSRAGTRLPLHRIGVGLERGATRSGRERTDRTATPAGNRWPTTGAAPRVIATAAAEPLMPAARPTRLRVVLVVVPVRHRVLSTRVPESASSGDVQEIDGLEARVLVEAEASGLQRSGLIRGHAMAGRECDWSGLGGARPLPR